MNYLSIDRSVCPLHCVKTEDRVRMPFGIIGRTVPGMGQVVRFGDRSTGRGTFGSEFGERHFNQWGLYGLRVRQCGDAALFPNYFGQTFYIIICSFCTSVSMLANHGNGCHVSVQPRTGWRPKGQADVEYRRNGLFTPPTRTRQDSFVSSVSAV